MARPTSPSWGLPHATDHPVLDKLRARARPTTEELDELGTLDQVKSAIGVMMQWTPLPGRTVEETIAEWRRVLRRLLRRRRR